jgi:transposase-like protein
LKQEEAVTTGSSSAQACPRCESTNTLRTESGRTTTSWYCFGCRRSFDVNTSGLPHIERRRGADRRQTSTAGSPRKGS